jgi:hypothetical protein
MAAYRLPFLFTYGSAVRKNGRFYFVELSFRSSPRKRGSSAKMDSRFRGNERTLNSSGLSYASVSAMRTRLSASTIAVPAIASAAVNLLLVNTPMMSRRPVKIRSAIIGSGSARLSTT